MIYLKIAENYEEKKNYDKSLEFYEKGVGIFNLNPENDQFYAKIHEKYAEMLLKVKNDKKKARYFTEKAIKIYEENDDEEMIKNLRKFINTNL